MSRVIKEIKDIFSNMNKISSNFIYYGSMLVIAIFAAGIVSYVSAGRLGNYYLLIELSENLFKCAKDCAAAIYIPAGIIEVLVIANKIDESDN